MVVKTYSYHVYQPKANNKNGRFVDLDNFTRDNGGRTKRPNRDAKKPGGLHATLVAGPGGTLLTEQSLVEANRGTAEAHIPPVQVPQNAGPSEQLFAATHQAILHSQQQQQQQLKAQQMLGISAPVPSVHTTAPAQGQYVFSNFKMKARVGSSGTGQSGGGRRDASIGKAPGKSSMPPLAPALMFPLPGFFHQPLAMRGLDANMMLPPMGFLVPNDMIPPPSGQTGSNDAMQATPLWTPNSTPATTLPSTPVMQMPEHVAGSLGDFSGASTPSAAGTPTSTFGSPLTMTSLPPSAASDGSELSAIGIAPGAVVMSKATKSEDTTDGEPRNRTSVSGKESTGKGKTSKEKSNGAAKTQHPVNPHLRLQGGLPPLLPLPPISVGPPAFMPMFPAHPLLTTQQLPTNENNNETTMKNKQVNGGQSGNAVLNHGAYMLGPHNFYLASACASTPIMGSSSTATPPHSPSTASTAAALAVGSLDFASTMNSSPGLTLMPNTMPDSILDLSMDGSFDFALPPLGLRFDNNDVGSPSMSSDESLSSVFMLDADASDFLLSGDDTAFDASDATVVTLDDIAGGCSGQQDSEETLLDSNSAQTPLSRTSSSSLEADSTAKTELASRPGFGIGNDGTNDATQLSIVTMSSASNLTATPAATADLATIAELDMCAAGPGSSLSGATEGKDGSHTGGQLPSGAAAAAAAAAIGSFVAMDTTDGSAASWEDAFGLYSSGASDESMASLSSDDSSDMFTAWLVGPDSPFELEL